MFSTVELWNVLVLLMPGMLGIQTVSATPSTPNISHLLTCDFEAGSFCQWTRASSWDWMVTTGAKSRKRKNADYLPLSDHTSENDQGKFIYVREKYGSAKKGAKMTSAKFRLPASGICFKFWYFMYGERVSRMSVTLHTWSLTRTLWWRSGSQGPRWKYAQVYVKAGPGEDKVLKEYATIYFELFTGTDMLNPALDDLRANIGACPQPDYCDFENEDMCQFKQSNSDDFDWSLNSQPTPATGTGPGRDHTLESGYGHYVHIDASKPRVQNDTAVLKTGLFSGDPTTCLSFWYNMDGKTMGTLNVRVKSGKSGGKDDETLAWSKSGNQGVDWHLAYVTISTPNPFAILFQGVVGSGEYSDIAIDDVSVHPGFCPAMGSCDFEGDECSWSNVKDGGDDLDWNMMSGHNGRLTGRPRADHTMNSRFGVYLYLHGDKKRRRQVAKYLSPSLDKGTSHCLTLWYTMDLGNLTIIRQALMSKMEIGGVFNTTGKTRNGWNRIRLTIGEHDTESNIVIIGTVDSRDQVSIDDIALQEGSCESLPDPTQTKNRFRCQKGGRYLSSQQVCDFDKDCPDGEEEQTCGYDCDFENVTACKWGVSHGDALRWTVMDNANGQFMNGPVVDATLKTKAGHFLYLGSITTRSANGQLVSPLIKRSAPNCQLVFSLFYHKTTKRFAVYKRNGGEDTELFTARGDYGMTWMQVTLSIGQSKSPFQIVMKASQFSSYSTSGSLAIDDVSFRNCSYPVPSTSCTPQHTFQCQNEACIHPSMVCNFVDDCGDGTDERDTICSPYRACSFESGLCGWSQDKDEDDFDWTWSKEDRPYSNVRPDMDHTTSTKDGNFLYTDAGFFKGRLPGDKAWLLSPVIEPTDVCTLHMYLVMYGENVERFSIYTRMEIPGYLTPVFTISGEAGKFWFFKSIDINSPNDKFQIILEGIVGNTSASDIFIDDVVLSPSCNISSGSLPELSTTPTTRVTSPCPSPNQWQCSDKSACVFQYERCDFIAQCGDESDERDCGTCDFESSSCGWLDESIGGFRWGRVNTSLTAVRDKPSRDHTYQGREVGSYLLAYSRGSGYRRPVVLESPVLGSTETGCTIRFYYQGQGRDRLTLHLYPKETTSYERGTDFRLWRAPVSRTWKEATVSIGSRSGGFRLVFVYDNKNDLKEHTFAAAIDDISFSSGCGMRKSQTCSHREFTCKHSHECKPMTARCDLAEDCQDGEDEKDCDLYTRVDFEQRSRDVFRHDSGDGSLQWTLEQPSSKRDTQAPDRDHTYGDDTGHYKYVRPHTTSSKPRRRVARMTGPLMYDSQEGSCYMGLFYHLNGNYNDSDGIRVYTVTRAGGRLDLKWSASKEEGDEWRKAVIPIVERSLFQVVIEGVRSLDYRGDIAVDDISFTKHCVQVSRFTYKLPPSIAAPPSGTCQMNSEFWCDGKCLSNTKWCDFNTDCRDASDEAGCPSRCDFEKGSCGWTNSSVGYLHWGTKLASETKIPADHNPGTPQGHLLVSDTSSYRRSHKIYLISPPFTATSRDCVFSLWYREYKSSLPFTITFRSGYSDNNVIWSQEQRFSVHDTWQQVNVSLPPCLSDVQVVVEIDQYDLSRSLFLDDFAFIGCGTETPPAACKPGEFQCSNSHCIPEDSVCDVSFDCCDGSDEEPTRCYDYKKNTFETGYGDLKIRPGHKTWMIQTAGQQTKTGPKLDHTTFSAVGHYLHLRCGGNFHPFVGSVLFDMPAPNGDCIIRFWYQLDDSVTGSLGVFTSTLDDKVTLQINITRSAGTWTRSEVKVDLRERYELTFEGRCTGWKVYSIDDVVFSPGCNIKTLPPPTTPGTQNTARDHPPSTTQTSHPPTSTTTTHPTTTTTMSTTTTHPTTSTTHPTTTTTHPTTTTTHPTTTTTHPITSTTTSTKTHTTKTDRATPTHPSSTKTQNPSTESITAIPCGSTQRFQCSTDNTCISHSKVCDFNSDCPDDSDERPCHTQHTCDFDTDWCGWKDGVTDRLHWTRASSSDTPTDLGPSFDASGQTGSYIYIQNNERDDTPSVRTAFLNSEQFSSSAADCAIEFYYFLNGHRHGTLSLQIKPDPATSTVLWQTHTTSGIWTKAIVGIGRRSSPFRLTFVQSTTPSSHCGQVALDKITFSPSCRQHPVQNRCSDGRGVAKYFRCGRGSCVPRQDVCDGQDDCGDGSDETGRMCQGQGYSREDFESTRRSWTWTSPVGQSSRSEAVVGWSVWNGSQPIPDGLLGVDHSSYSPTGHYLYVQGGLKTGPLTTSSWLVSEAFTPGTSPCQIVFHTLLPTAHQSLVLGYRVYKDGPVVAYKKPTKVLIPGSYWQRVALTFDDVTLPFQLVLKASLGGAGGALAIDDVTTGPHCRYYNGQLPPAPRSGRPSSRPTAVDNTHEGQEGDQHSQVTTNKPLGNTGTYYGNTGTCRYGVVANVHSRKDLDRFGIDLTRMVRSSIIPTWRYVRLVLYQWDPGCVGVENCKNWKTPVGVVLGLAGTITVVVVVIFYLRRSGRVGGFRFRRFDRSGGPTRNSHSHPGLENPQSIMMTGRTRSQD